MAFCLKLLNLSTTLSEDFIYSIISSTKKWEDTTHPMKHWNKTETKDPMVATSLHDNFHSEENGIFKKERKNFANGVGMYV